MSGMGSAIAGVVILPSSVFVFNVGDCRVYRSGNDGLCKVTHDHSVVQQLCDEGTIFDDDMRIYDLAARRGLPVLIHHNISSASKRDPIYLAEMERAISANPKTTFIWAHAGVSRRVDVPTLCDDIARLLRTCPNLNFDLSWVVYDTITKDSASLATWIRLIESFPDRFMIGSDKVGRWSGYEREMTRYNVLIAKLSPGTADRFCRTNIRRILGETK